MGADGEPEYTSVSPVKKPLAGGISMSGQRTLVPGLNVLEQADATAAAGKKANGHSYPGLPVPPAPVTQNIISTSTPKPGQQKKQQPKAKQQNAEMPSADQWPPSLK